MIKYYKVFSNTTSGRDEWHAEILLWSNGIILLPCQPFSHSTSYQCTHTYIYSHVFISIDVLFVLLLLHLMCVQSAWVVWVLVELRVITTGLDSRGHKPSAITLLFWHPDVFWLRAVVIITVAYGKKGWGRKPPGAHRHKFWKSVSLTAVIE